MKQIKMETRPCIWLFFLKHTISLQCLLRIAEYTSMLQIRNSKQHLRSIQVLKSSVVKLQRLNIYWKILSVCGMCIGLKKTQEVSPSTSEAVKRLDNHKTKAWLEVYLLVAMPIATVSFAAAFTMPGGYNNGGPDKGMPIFKDKLVFKAFVVSDALAFAFSLGGVILHSSAAKNNRARVRYNKIQQKLIASAIIALAIAFASGIYIVLTKSNGLGWTGYIILACLFLVYQVCWFVDPYSMPVTKALKSAHRHARNLLYRYGVL